MSIKEVIIETMDDVASQKGVPAPLNLSDDSVLLETGIDSLGFAVLVTRLEQELGYDPFVLMEEAVYPRTWGEFVALYERFSSERKPA